jgi:hypothetical protein
MRRTVLVLLFSVVALILAPGLALAAHGHGPSQDGVVYIGVRPN